MGQGHSGYWRQAAVRIFGFVASCCLSSPEADALCAAGQSFPLLAAGALVSA